VEARTLEASAGRKMAWTEMPADIVRGQHRIRRRLRAAGELPRILSWAEGMRTTVRRSMAAAARQKHAPKRSTGSTRIMTTEPTAPSLNRGLRLTTVRCSRKGTGAAGAAAKTSPAKPRCRRQRRRASRPRRARRQVHSSAAAAPRRAVSHPHQGRKKKFFQKNSGSAAQPATAVNTADRASAQSGKKAARLCRSHGPQLSRGERKPSADGKTPPLYHSLSQPGNGHSSGILRGTTTFMRDSPPRPRAKALPRASLASLRTFSLWPRFRRQSRKLGVKGSNS